MARQAVEADLEAIARAAHGLRDENVLESALARPQQRWHYDPTAHAEVLDAMLRLAAGRMDEAELASWIEAHSQAI